MDHSAVRYRLSVCKGPDCTRNGGNDVFRAFREELSAQKVPAERCEARRGGCYGLCHLGPNVVVRQVDPNRVADPMQGEDFTLLYSPGETYYWHLTPGDAETIVTEHILGGRAVESLVGDPESTQLAVRSKQEQVK